MSTTLRRSTVAVRTPRDLGLVIRERRRQLRLDQQSLAERVGVSRQWIIEAERGKTRAPVGLVLRTLEALGLRLSIEDERAERETSLPSIDIDAIVRRARKPRA